MKTPTTLIILDGYGNEAPSVGNAIANTPQPNLSKYLNEHPHCQLHTSGLHVGLPDGQMGNSEVGHTNIGAGRIVYQDLPKITKDIEEGTFFEKEALKEVVDHCREWGSALHFYGLMSDGGVHSHTSHLKGLIQMAKKQGLTKVFIHCFLDGRDVPPSSGIDYVRGIAEYCKAEGIGEIATISGRFYAMDRDNRWERVEKAYNAMVLGEGIQESDPVKAVADSYAKDVTDEFFEPVVVNKAGLIKEKDGIICFNYRPDRAREITRTFVDEDFSGFERKNGYFPVCFACMTEYDATMPNVSVVYPREKLEKIFGEYISSLGLTQLRIAETEKYAHVTFFFNGGVEAEFPGEDRCLIASPKVTTYDEQPEMSAHEVTEQCVSRIESGNYDVIILNFANCDMVGHTGNYEAACKAVETMDACVKQVVEATSRMGGVSMITADHGNCEKMYEPDGKPFTAHTTNPVPFAIIGANVTLRDGKLADIAPTMLDLMGLEQPAEMTGETLIVK